MHRSIENKWKTLNRALFKSWKCINRAQIKWKQTKNIELWTDVYWKLKTYIKLCMDLLKNKWKFDENLSELYEHVQSLSTLSKIVNNIILRIMQDLQNWMLTLTKFHRTFFPAKFKLLVQKLRLRPQKKILSWNFTENAWIIAKNEAKVTKNQRHQEWCKGNFVDNEMCWKMRPCTQKSALIQPSTSLGKVPKNGNSKGPRWW